MAAPTIMEHSQATYMPTTHAAHSRHGVMKHRKSQSTGGGRAWSVAEEAFLIEKREQKMPYKHIAAHLNKTDLACRLHYYQIHGNRRKRNLSCSSMPAALGWEHHGHHHHHHHHAGSLPPSPPESAVTSAPGSPKSNSVRSMSAAPVGAHDIHLPPILPRASSVESTGRPFPSVEEARRVPLPPLAAAQPRAQSVVRQTESLHLDTSYPTINSSYQYHDAGHIDMGRLQAIYARHGQSFWTTVAAEYGPGAPSPASLEQAWRTGSCCPQHSAVGGARPITPGESPMSISSLVSLAAEKHHNPWELPAGRVPEDRVLA